MSSIEEKVIDEFRQRAKKGETKYGTTMDRDDLSFVEWMQHLKEELMDAIVYTQKVIEKEKLPYENRIFEPSEGKGSRRNGRKYWENTKTWWGQDATRILDYIEMHRGTMCDFEVLEDIMCGSYVDEYINWNVPKIEKGDTQ
tara:strand:+ start:99 stop:524 length:426 start_codon:yes stop_codon:yes gene_type:complete